MSCFKTLLPLSCVLIGLSVGAIPTIAQTPGESSVSLKDNVKQSNKKQNDLPPTVRIVSPVADALIAPGEGRVGASSPNGTGFAINLG